MGYHHSGFDEIVGVDIAPQPRYPFEFVQADALEFVAEYGHEFDAIHASPPCQGYSIMHNLPWLRGREYPRLIKPVRHLLARIERPWVIENVMGAKWGCKNLVNISSQIGYDITDHGMRANYLCGSAFGKPFYRHRLFESNWFWLAPGHPRHKLNLHPRSERYVYGGTVRGLPGGAAGLDVRPRENPVNSAWRQYHDGALNIRPGYEKVPFSYPTIVGERLRANGRPNQVAYRESAGRDSGGLTQPANSLASGQGNGAQGNGVGIGHAKGWWLAAEAMGIDWMKRDELTQAIPPAFTEFIGRQMLLVL